MANLRPASLPKARDQFVRAAEDPSSAMRRCVDGKPLECSTGELLAATAHLPGAELFWVAPDMAALAMSAGSTLGEAAWGSADRPCTSGLLVWDEGVGLSSVMGETVPVDAVSWGPAADGAMSFGVYIARDRFARMLPDIAHLIGRGVDLAAVMPPLWPVAYFELPGGDPAPIADLKGPRPLYAALAAAWLLMEQPTLVERSQESAPKVVQRSYARARRPVPTVTIVDLRKIYRPQADDEEADEPSRQYRHRWVVSGHWRNQAFGPSRSLRRPKWIPAYVKGPDGAPLLATERVNVWRR